MISDIIKPPLRVSDFPDASLTFVTRFDYVDLNDGTFSLTDQNIGDTQRRLTVGFSFRPTPETTLRLSYLRNWNRDPFNNLSNSMNFQFGVATYF